MARWVFDCPICREELTHSQIFIDNSTVRDPVMFAIRPEMPARGMRVACPNCKNISVFYRHQLTYRAS